jgi:hypothetical protein
MRVVSKQQVAGVALVTTVIVVAVLAVVAVAFMQSTSTDRLSSRTVANYYKAQLAAKAGLAEAMALIQQGAQNFTYVSAAETEGDSYRTYLRPLVGTSGVWKFSGAPVYLDSGPGGGGGAKLLLTGSLKEPGLTRSAAWKDVPLESARPNETKRYAFWVDDAAGKQNLTWWGGGGARGVVTNLADVSLALPNAQGTEAGPFPQTALAALSERRSYAPFTFDLAGRSFTSRRANVSLPSVASLQLLAPGVLGDSMERYFFTIASASGAASPAGRDKLNIGRLREYVNSLNSNQGAQSPRALLVEELLKDEPNGADQWGGGSFSWLAQSGKYSPAEQRQIVANIIDYLDDDLIPTTDSVDSPTYFGVEYKLNADGTVRGHPSINMVGLGLVFNWSSAAQFLGWLNSTRALAFLGLVNPWSSSLPVQAYTPEISFSVAGKVGGGTLGDAPERYFLPDLNEQLDTGPVTELEPRSGATFPGAASGLNFANFKNLLGEGNRQPATITFSELVYTTTKIRLRFQSDDGTDGYVQVLPQGLSVTMQPTTVSSPGAGGSRVYKFTGLAQNQEDLHLSGDPRGNFLAAAWANAKSSGGNSADVPKPDPEVDIFANAGPDSDGPQGLPTGSSWFTSPQVANHFSRLSRAGMESIGELGYLWTGKPWQTLNLTSVDNPDQADWNLLDYITAGSAAAGPLLPLKSAATGQAGTVANALLSSGGFNINTRKLATIRAVLENAPDLNAQAINGLMQAPAASQASAYGTIAAAVDEAPALLVANAGTKFGKEAAQRALANLAVNHSRIFTVYATGEYRLGDAVSRAQLEADVFVGVDPVTGSAMIQVIDQRFR